MLCLYIQTILAGDVARRGTGTKETPRMMCLRRVGSSPNCKRCRFLLDTDEDSEAMADEEMLDLASFRSSNVGPHLQ